MKTKEIRKRAEAFDLKLKSKNKTQMIRAIQEAEGNPQCFRSGLEHCEHVDCCWLEECIPQQFAEVHSQGGVGARTGKWRR